MQSLQQLHALGYVHRDIKPNNILVKNDEEFKEDHKVDICLIDYGFAELYVKEDGSHIEES